VLRDLRAPLCKFTISYLRRFRLPVLSYASVIEQKQVCCETVILCNMNRIKGWLNWDISS